VFLPAGTVHALGGGVLLAEIQQTSDATFRLFDWDRRDAQGNSRPLHIEEALACIDWSRGPVAPVRAAGFVRPAETVRELERQPLVRCPYFELEYLQSRQPFAVGGQGRLQALIAVRGQGRWDAAGGEAITAGQAWLLPASLPRVECHPNPVLGALLCTLP
jgi:mannose-6-phosphate isomerase